MTAEMVILVAIAGVGIMAVLSAFTIVYRRSTSKHSGDSGVDRETLLADRRRSIDLPGVHSGDDPVTHSKVAEAQPDPAPASDGVEPPRSAVAVSVQRRLVEVSPEQQGVTRRRFFNRALGTTFLTLLGVLGLQFLAFLWPRLRGGFGADVVVSGVKDLLDEARNDDGTITPVFIPEARAYIVPAPDPLPEIYRGKSVVAGGVFAIWQRCVHLGCRVPWCQTSQGFECPCHGSKYSVIGEYFAGPAPRSLDRFVVEETDAGDLLVKTGQIVQTPRLSQLNVPYPQGPFCVS